MNKLYRIKQLYENFIINDKDLFKINNKLNEDVDFNSVLNLIETLLLETVDLDKESKLIINLVNHMFDRKKNDLDTSHIEKIIENKLMLKNDIALTELKSYINRNSKMSYFPETIPYIINLLNTKLGIKNTTDNYSTKPSTNQSQSKEKTTNQTTNNYDNNKYSEILSSLEIKLSELLNLPTTLRKEASLKFVNDLLAIYTQIELKNIHLEFVKKYGSNSDKLDTKLKKLYMMIKKAYDRSFSTKYNKK